MKFARRWHISRWNTHTLSYVVPLEEHTGSSNDGQLSTQMHRASLGPNALHTAKYLQETLMHGSRSVNKWYAQQFKMKNLDQIKCKFSYSFMYLFDHYLFDNVGVILQDPTAKFKCTLGDRWFPAAAPKKWNGLPDYIRKENDFDMFKRLIKTHYFKEAYSDLPWAIVGLYFLLLSSLFTSYLLWVMLNYLLGRKCSKWLSFSM